MMVEHEKLCRHLARFFMARHLNASFGESFPTVPGRMTLAALTTGARARTAFQRLQVQTVAELGPLSVKNLYDVRGTGQGTVEEVVTALVSAAVIRAGHAPEDAISGEDASFTNTAEASLSPAQAQLLEDLAQLAAWHHLRRRSSHSLLNVIVEDGAPEQIQEVALRLNSLTAADMVTNVGAPDPILEFTAVLSELDERQLRILRDRFLGRTPKKLTELAVEFDVSRERVRQIEVRLKDLLASTFHFGTCIGNLLASLRAEIQPIAALDRLIILHPDLARDVPGVDVPLWLVLDRLDEHFEVSDGWAAAPDVNAAREQTRILLEDFATEHGLVDLAAATSATVMPKAELLSWLRWCGYVVYNDQILTRTRSLNDHAAGLLAATGEPLQTDELHKEMGRDATIRSLTNVLGSDGRFVRTDRSTWGLASWEIEEYTSIRQQIGLELVAAGGEIELSRLVESITSRFDVSPSSVQAYAGNGEYEIIDRVVRRRVIPAAPRKAPSATRRLFRHGDVWKLRITITRDHLRGSGFPVPAGVASLVGCAQGEVVELDSELGSQSIRWTGLQPASGTIKRFLDQLQAMEGQTAFLEFHPYGRFCLTVQEPVAAGRDPLAQALELTGAVGTGDAERAKAILAAAIDLPEDAKPRRILVAYRQRGDDDIAALLEQVWTRQRHDWTDQQATGEERASTSMEPVGLDPPGSVATSEGDREPHVPYRRTASAGADDVTQDDGVLQEDSATVWVPVPAGYRSVGWVRPHEAEAAVLAYQLHADVPVHDGDEITGWARYVDGASTNAFDLQANVKLVRTRPQGERITCWIKEHEAFSVTQAAAEGRSVAVTGPDGETTGLVEYYQPDGEEARRFLSSTRLLRGRRPN
ncbi:sigma factor-like helix-turn-helix DNA-binding protein [Micromonospora echinofusca]|uniref:sigma factor-like helix-turn-helix DNA-binding protein n=1 Tax=Micromonospora echinofusca TaxID=47858 RepID=UPI002021425A|nr:sigma factor-like helix-turn-helix DNA-binding protein [Micromonospora sp. MSM11]MCL7458596.1 hypothetical protein [Micromonospora sp. MSM11]